MISHGNHTLPDKSVFLARLGNEILTERKRLALELRELLNERRLARTKLRQGKTLNHSD